MKRMIAAAGCLITLSLLSLVSATPARAFCGFYVGKAGAELFNEASQVVLARDGNRTIVTMSNDFKGSLTEFALVVPVPAVISKDQVHIGERKFIERVDAYSSPRLVEYHDSNPCEVRREMSYRKGMGGAAPPPMARAGAERARSLGVTIEAQYTVGEYDIIILSAKQSQGLTTFLIESGYNIPPRAEKALAPYIKQEMKFFVAKVNLKEQGKTGFTYLRPIQIAYESPKFMLPIRLGMANSQGPQDLVIYALTRKGRVESTNYQTKQVPTGMDIPTYVRSDFGSFYKAVFHHSWEKADKKSLLTEYVWDTGWCDPCAAEPLSQEELRGLGVFWLPDSGDNQSQRGFRFGGGSGAPVLTRLHVRYDSDHFPEDLVFQETGDRQNFQARYVLRYPWTGDDQCEEAATYRQRLDERHKAEAQALADLTGWEMEQIHKGMGADAPGQQHTEQSPWYKRLWK